MIYCPELQFQLNSQAHANNCDGVMQLNAVSTNHTSRALGLCRLIIPVLGH